MFSQRSASLTQTRSDYLEHPSISAYHGTRAFEPDVPGQSAISPRDERNCRQISESRLSAKRRTTRELETVGESIGVQARICSSSRQPVLHHRFSVGVEFALLHILDHIEVAGCSVDSVV
jgi:hypothetical protein